MRTYSYKTYFQRKFALIFFIKNKSRLMIWKILEKFQKMLNRLFLIILWWCVLLFSRNKKKSKFIVSYYCFWIQIPVLTSLNGVTFFLQLNKCNYSIFRVNVLTTCVTYMLPFPVLYYEIYKNKNLQICLFFLYKSTDQKRDSWDFIYRCILTQLQQLK